MRKGYKIDLSLEWPVGSERSDNELKLGHTVSGVFIEEKEGQNFTWDLGYAPQMWDKKYLYGTKEFGGSGVGSVTNVADATVSNAARQSKGWTIKYFVYEEDYNEKVWAELCFDALKAFEVHNYSVAMAASGLEDAIRLGERIAKVCVPGIER